MRVTRCLKNMSMPPTVSAMSWNNTAFVEHSVPPTLHQAKPCVPARGWMR